MGDIDDYREFLKGHLWEGWEKLETDQRKHLPPPPLQKPYPAGAVLVELVPPDDFTVGGMPLIEAIRRRKSHRKFAPDSLTLEELSFLLWATQGVHRVVGDGLRTLRTVPSGGARHSFETYLFVHRVEELECGLYRYLPLEHKLCFLDADPDLATRVTQACRPGQNWVGNSIVPSGDIL